MRIQSFSKDAEIKFEVLSYPNPEAVTIKARVNAEHIFSQLVDTCDYETYAALFSLFRKIDKGEAQLDDIIKRNQERLLCNTLLHKNECVQND
jgi:phosphoribosylformylglycinamidine (FGAM) synthase PurS component